MVRDDLAPACRERERSHANSQQAQFSYRMPKLSTGLEGKRSAGKEQAKLSSRQGLANRNYQ
jgi:hypothetical protein